MRSQEVRRETKAFENVLNERLPHVQNASLALQAAFEIHDPGTENDDYRPYALWEMPKPPVAEPNFTEGTQLLSGFEQDATPDLDREDGTLSDGDVDSGSESGSEEDLLFHPQEGHEGEWEEFEVEEEESRDVRVPEPGIICERPTQMPPINVERLRGQQPMITQLMPQRKGRRMNSESPENQRPQKKTRLNVASGAHPMAPLQPRPQQPKIVFDLTSPARPAGPRAAAAAEAGFRRPPDLQLLHSNYRGFAAPSQLSAIHPNSMVYDARRDSAQHVRTYEDYRPATPPPRFQSPPRFHRRIEISPYWSSTLSHTLHDWLKHPGTHAVEAPLLNVSLSGTNMQTSSQVMAPPGAAQGSSMVHFISVRATQCSTLKMVRVRLPIQPQAPLFPPDILDWIVLQSISLPSTTSPPAYTDDKRPYWLLAFPACAITSSSIKLLGPPSPLSPNHPVGVAGQAQKTTLFLGRPGRFPLLHGRGIDGQFASPFMEACLDGTGVVQLISQGQMPLWA